MLHTHHAVNAFTHGCQTNYHAIMEKILIMHTPHISKTDAPLSVDSAVYLSPPWGKTATAKLQFYLGSQEYSVHLSLVACFVLHAS